ncbi:50S ribosomal protein L29 [Limnoglobus roseus]|uniref:Large ribosomal subunit protein uL29 n=1 Tax=Limnoglobus roseus TaxID=2598579 RepID=A0A5C1AN36_9BACT|nr:50S ribosomal protein L29 [Limnoglobus roseus]QEL19985.1 50S ribosomal protein L29 [Limnoglobus roseus]
MKPAEVAKENDEQLKLSLAETEKHLFKLRFQSATDRLETPSEIRKARKDIARIKTEQRRRELVAESKKSDEQLATTVALAEKGEVADGKPFVGRRKPLRVVQRIQEIQAARAAARKMPPAKGK